MDQEPFLVDNPDFYNAYATAWCSKTDAQRVSYLKQNYDKVRSPLLWAAAGVWRGQNAPRCS